MTAIVDEDRTRVHPAEGASIGMSLGWDGFGASGGGFRSDADVVILGYD